MSVGSLVDVCIVKLEEVLRFVTWRDEDLLAVIILKGIFLFAIKNTCFELDYRIVQISFNFLF